MSHRVRGMAGGGKVILHREAELSAEKRSSSNSTSEDRVPLALTILITVLSSYTHRTVINSLEYTRMWSE